MLVNRRTSSGHSKLPKTKHRILLVTSPQSLYYLQGSGVAVTGACMIASRRNLLVSQADAVVAVGGGAGTLSEIALAWMYFRLIIAFRGHAGPGS